MLSEGCARGSVLCCSWLQLCGCRAPAPVLPKETALVASVDFTPKLPLRCSALQMVLLVLVKLLAEPAVQDRAPAVLSQLLSGNVELQKAAADADAATKLAAFLCKEDCRAPLQAGSLPHMLGRAGLQSSTHAAQGRFAIFHLTSLRWLGGLC